MQLCDWNWTTVVAIFWVPMRRGSNWDLLDVDVIVLASGVVLCLCEIGVQADVVVTEDFGEERSVLRFWDLISGAGGEGGKWGKGKVGGR